jgi:hypothetical protein
MTKLANELSIEELKALLKSKKEEAATEWQSEGYKIRKEVDAYVLKKYGKQLKEWGKKPADIYMCPNPDRPVRKGDTFKNPDPKAAKPVWTYSGKGMLPDWLKGHEEEYKIAKPATNGAHSGSMDIPAN